MNYNKDDYVVCIGDNNISPSLARASSGWKKNKCFKIMDITGEARIKILWPYPQGNGVYSDSVRLASIEEIAEYERLGRPYISTFNDRGLLEFVESLDNHINRMEEKVNDPAEERIKV